jgi:predicted RND superfamily exporter protein
MEPLARGSKGFSQFTNFDFNWGSGNRFFSKDHRSLLIITQPRESAVDYQFAEEMMAWVRRTIPAIAADAAFRDAGLRVTPAGAYVYAEQDRQFIQKNIRLISVISIVGNLVLCLLVYPSIPLFLLSLLPTSLGILWTTGVASYYPGEVNLISMSFIAILAGLGDDQIVHFFNRVPQEWVKAGSLEEALTWTFQLTGPSILFCILTASTATAALALSTFKVLAEFGFILTVGMFMMLIHTLLTVPALMRLWWRFSKPRAPETITFRFLPFVTRHTMNFVGRHARLVAGISAGAFVLSLAALPMVRMSAKIEISRGEDNPAIAGQRRLSAAFGIEGSPEVLLISGNQEEVLRRSEDLTSRLEAYQRSGLVRTVFTPTSMVPSRHTQAERTAALSGVNFEAAALAVEASIRDNGFRREPFQPFLQRLRELGSGAPPVSVETASAYVPAGLLDNSIRKTATGEYLAAIAYYGTDPDATEVIPDKVLQSWRRQCGPFIDFSFNKINRDMQRHILADSRRALVLTAFGILLIVYLCFRNFRDSLLVVLPIVFAITATFAMLLLFGHRFSFMSVTAIPLIIGIGIDNGIHLIRRYRESGDRSILEVAQASGAALIQSNLTTMVGFGALTASSFAPLAEMGIVTVLGVALALVAALIAVPAVILMSRKTPTTTE